METVTIKDIAKALNLSTSTVSRALRGSYEISPETKKVVLEYAEKINYRPNPIALSLKENRSRSIGVIVPEIDNPFFSQAINGIETIVYNRGYHVLIFQSYESYQREVINVQHLASRRVDGVLISLSGQTTDIDHLRELQDKGMPIVFFDRFSDEINTHKVIADNFDGAFKATEHLIKSGRRRIAHIAASASLSITKERINGYRAALNKYQRPIDDTLIKYCGYSLVEVDNVIGELLADDNPPDAIFTASDRLAVSCLTALKNKHVDIPKQMAVVGFTNLKVAHLFDPPLSTVMQPAMEMGQTAAELLLDLIERKSKGPITYQTIKLPTEMIIRESC
ncbi:MAG: LacI family DNA-binding transcriptional regulator [Flectobacillus sp.]|nr:LacI family DNA-binding transcriptional regulator [Flectobacillus sp.]